MIFGLHQADRRSTPWSSKPRASRPNRIVRISSMPAKFLERLLSAPLRPRRSSPQNDERQHIVLASEAALNRLLPYRKRQSVRLPVVDVHRDFEAETHITIAGFTPLHSVLLIRFLCNFWELWPDLSPRPYHLWRTSRIASQRVGHLIICIIDSSIPAAFSYWRH